MTGAKPADKRVGEEDCTGLLKFDEASILGNLEDRYAQDVIYTNTSSVLLAVNPYKSL